MPLHQNSQPSRGKSEPFLRGERTAAAVLCVVTCPKKLSPAGNTASSGSKTPCGRAFHLCTVGEIVQKVLKLPKQNLKIILEIFPFLYLCLNFRKQI